MLDQASKLRQIVKEIDANVKGTRIYSILSGKGGVGKTRFALELEGDFLEIGKKVRTFNIKKLHESGKEELINSLQAIRDYEVVIINNSDGYSEEALKFTKLAHEAILVTRPGISAITESYKLLKMLDQEGIKNHVKILVNNREDLSGEDTFKKLDETSRKFLDIRLEDITDISRDDLVESLYNSDLYSEAQLKGKILDIFGG